MWYGLGLLFRRMVRDIFACFDSSFAGDVLMVLSSQLRRVRTGRWHRRSLPHPCRHPSQSAILPHQGEIRGIFP